MKKITLIGLLYLLPFLALAQASAPTIGGLMSTMAGILNALIPFLITIALIVFIWGVIQYVSAGEDEEKRGKGRNLMINGIIALFVIVSVWGLVAVLNSTFGISAGGGPGGVPTPPPVPPS
jgi:uncharacterized membrane protein YidH (DUF202 family)